MVEEDDWATRLVAEDSAECVKIITVCVCVVRLQSTESQCSATHYYSPDLDVYTPALYERHANTVTGEQRGLDAVTCFRASQPIAQQT